MNFYLSTFENVTNIPELFAYIFIFIIGNRQLFERRYSSRSKRRVNRFSEFDVFELQKINKTV